MNSSLKLAVALLSSALLSDCALLSKSTPLTPRYFSPESVETPARTASSATKAPAGLALQLGRVVAGAYLRERIVYRTSSHELAAYEDLRWTERPEVYLRRALSRALFEERGLGHVVSGAASTLDVELVSFEELRVPQHAVRVQVLLQLSDAREARSEQSVVVLQPMAAGSGDDAERLVTAFAQALDAMVEQIADRVVGQLTAQNVSY